MREKLHKAELCELLKLWLPIDGKITPSSNWFEWIEVNEQKAVYVSQCKPSSFSKGNWYYEFFHTLSSKSMDKILENQFQVVLIDYATRRFTILNHDDVNWVYDNSSRVRKKGGLVTDFVVRLSGKKYYLEPSLAGTRMYREIEVGTFQ